MSAPFESTVVSAEMESVRLSSSDDDHWPFSFSLDDSRLEPGVSCVGRTAEMDSRQEYVADCGITILYDRGTSDELNGLVNSKKVTGRRVLLNSWTWFLFQKLHAKQPLAFKSTMAEYQSKEIAENIIDQLIKRFGTGKESDITRADLATFITTDGGLGSDPIFLCTNYDALKIMFKNIHRCSAALLLIRAFNDLPYAIRFVTELGLFVDIPNILRSFDLPETVNELIELSINISPPSWGQREDLRFGKSLAVAFPSLNKNKEPLPIINPPGLDRGKSCLGRIIEMGHDQLYFMDSSLVSKMDVIPGLREWVEENQKRGFGVYLHPYTSGKLEREFRPVPTGFNITPKESAATVEDSHAYMTSALSKFNIDFSDLPEKTKETLVLLLQIDDVYWELMRFEDDINVILLTDDYETIRFVYADFNRLSALFHAGMDAISDFRLIHPGGFYADLDTHNQTFKVEGDLETFIQKCAASKPRFEFGENYEKRLRRVEEMRNGVAKALGKVNRTE